MINNHIIKEFLLQRSNPIIKYYFEYKFYHDLINSFLSYSNHLINQKYIPKALTYLSQKITKIYRELQFKHQILIPKDNSLKEYICNFMKKRCQKFSLFYQCINPKMLNNISLIVSSIINFISNDVEQDYLIIQEAISIEESIIHIPSLILMDIPKPKAIINKPYYIVAIFSTSLEIPPISHTSTQLSLPKGWEENPQTLEIYWLQHVAELLVRSGVTLVLTQQRIHPYLERLLLSSGISVVPRVSIRFINMSVTLSKAILLDQLDPSIVLSHDSILSTTVLGLLQSISLQTIFNKSYVAIESFSLKPTTSNSMDGLLQSIYSSKWNLDSIISCQTIFLTATNSLKLTLLKEIVHDLYNFAKYLMKTSQSSLILDPFACIHEIFNVIRLELDLQNSANHQLVATLMELMDSIEKINDSFGQKYHSIPMIKSIYMVCFQTFIGSLITLYGLDYLTLIPAASASDNEVNIT